MKKFINIKRLLLTILFILIIGFIALVVWLQGQYVVPILMYHNITSADTKPLIVIGHLSKGKLRLNCVSPQSFDRQLGFLKDHGYHVISLDEYVQRKKANEWFSHKTVVITFDDGYEDNYTNAFPILKKYHFPATIFLISDYVGKSPDFLSWEQVKEMSQYGISFGSHTRRHVYLPSISKEQMKDEIIGSKQIIEQHLGSPVYYFAYPGGGFSEEIKAITATAGYQAALATNRGYDRLNIDLYELNRIHINNWDNKYSLTGKLSGFYNLIRELKRSH